MPYASCGGQEETSQRILLIIECRSIYFELLLPQAYVLMLHVRPQRIAKKSTRKRLWELLVTISM
jgi:hypothetical protein